MPGGVFLWGFDSENDAWVKVRCAADGSIVTSSETSIETGYASKVLEYLVVDTVPAPAAWVRGATVTGASSGVSCNIIAVVTTKIYLINGRTGIFTSGEILSDGVNSVDCASGYPTIAEAGYTTTETLQISASPAPAAWSAGAAIVGVASTKVALVIAQLSSTLYLIQFRTGAFTDGEAITDGVNTYAGAAGNPVVTTATYTTLFDNTKNWEVDMWEGAILEMSIGGITYTRTITGNYANVLVFPTVYPGIPVAGTQYSIKFESAGEGSKYTWNHGHKTVAVPGTAEVFPTVSVPSGFALVVGALPTNTGYIYLGKTKLLAESATDRIPLAAGQTMRFYVYNSNLIWIDAVVGAEGAFYFAEGV